MMSPLPSDWTPAPGGYKHVVSVSLGSSKRNAREETEVLGQKFVLERIGTDGDMKRAGALLAALDGKVDAFDGKVDALATRVDTLDSKVDALDGKVDALSTTVESLDGKVDTIVELLQGR